MESKEEHESHEGREEVQTESSKTHYTGNNCTIPEIPEENTSDMGNISSKVVEKLTDKVDSTSEKPTEPSEVVNTTDESSVSVIKSTCGPEQSSITPFEGLCEKLSENCGVEAQVDSALDSFSSNVIKDVQESQENVIVSEEKETPVPTTSTSQPDVKKFVPEAFTDSSQSFSSGLQPSAVPLEPPSSEGNFNSVRTNFENGIESQVVWSKPQDLSGEGGKEDVVSDAASSDQPETLPASEIPSVTSTETIEAPPPIPEVIPSNNVEMPSFLGPAVQPPQTEVQVQQQPSTNENQSEVKVEEQPPPEPPPVPIVPPPAPRKRGRPRKQVLPNPSPLVESWGPNAQEFPTIEVKEERRSARAERRMAKRRKFEEEEKEKANGDAETPKRRFVVKPPVKKTPKKRPTYTPKKKLPPPKKKRSEMENIQNFEEETRMSASEGAAGFSSRSGAGDESQSSSVTAEGHTKSTNVNKKGRMEVVTDSCKPVTVQQIVEYYWPPPSSLPHGEKPEGLMIQEQITEYLGVKSFKRKYPSIKRRPVDMEERNYLQENGFVSENMCDMGLTAVFSADIIEIMYNDFPQKFEEYRKYTREKKAREQRALREKQAAERADMDPKKEAVESAFSWNNEFNKTRRLPKRNYNSKVLLGHWYEKNCDEEHKLAMYLKNKERGRLLIFGVRKLFANFLKYIPLPMSTKGLAYGGTVQVLAPDVVAAPSYAAHKPADGLLLAVTIESEEIERTQTIVNGLSIVGSPLRQPCARNTFIIDSLEGKAEGEEVCYGDTFTLRSAAPSEIPLYVELPSSGLTSAVGRCGFPNPTLQIYRSRDTRFKVLHACPDMRIFTDGTPCPPFERVVINLAPNNSALCVENDFWKMSLFTYECEISAKTKQKSKSEYSSQNLWMLVVGS